MFSQGTQPTIGYMDLLKHRKEFFADLASVSSKFESVARNWTPLLPLIKNFILYSTNQFSVLSDPDNPDPGWKEFSKEALTAIDKLQPIFDELSKSKSHLPQMFSYLIDLIKEIPRLIVYFDKLQLHIPLSEMIPQGEELKTDFPHLVMSRLQRNLPQYETIKRFLEDNYQKFTDLNGLEIFSKRTYLEKITFLTAMGGFNNTLKQLFLALDRVATQLGIRVDVLLIQPIFMRKQFSVEQLCKQFSKFYIEALAEAEFDLSNKKSLYPYLDEIIFQQKGILQELQDKSKLQGRVEALYTRTLTNMVDQAEKTLSIIEKNDAETLRHKNFLQGFLKTINCIPKKEDLSAIINALDANAEREAFKSKKNAKFIAAIKSIFTEMKSSIARMHEKEKNACLSLEIRIGKLEAKLETTDEIKEESKSEAEVDTTFVQIQGILTEIMQQFKKINATLESRPKKIEAAPEPLSDESQIEKALTLIYGQLEVMLDRNIYQQYILGIEPDTSANLHGAGWIVTVGTALNKVKLAFDKYNVLAVYFKSEKPEDTNGISPRDEVIVFMGKTQAMAEISQELIASLVALEKDSFIQNLLSSAGLKNIVYLQPLIAVADEKPNDEHSIDVELPDSVEKILDTIAKIYETSAQQHLHDKEKVKALRETLFGVYKLTQAYQDFKKLDKNKIQVSKTQLYVFIWRHFKDLFLVLGDVPSNLSDVIVVSKKEFSLLIRELNLGLRDFILLLNRIEIEFNLKQGYFTNNQLPDLFSIQLQETLKLTELPDAVKTTSLHDVITGIYKKLEDLNYTFPVNEQYPFYNTLQNQQLEILLKADRSTLKNRYSIYFVRQTITKQMHQRDVEAIVSGTNNKYYANEFNALIDANLNQLRSETSANKIILKSLLKKLTQRDTAIETLDDKVNTLSQNAYDRKNIYLLYQRHTRKLMMDLHQHTAVRADILDEIDDELTKLSEKRARYYFFFAKSRRVNLEATIFAYHELRQFMQRPGHRVTDFASESSQQYTLLVQHDKPMLVKLLRISEQSIYLKNEKLLAGDVLPHPEPVLTQAKRMILNLKQTSVISTRIAELRSQCMFSTRRKKVKLLETLQKHLETASLEKSLIAMQTDKDSQADFYLLHEGKTGQMLKELSQLTLTKKDMLSAISLEIFRLKQSRQEVFYFSQKSRKLLLEERIQACLAYRQAVEDSPAGASFGDALATLSDKDKKVLVKFESKLIDKLKAWETTNARFERVALPR
jgi:hypothetical protein